GGHFGRSLGDALFPCARRQGPRLPLDDGDRAETLCRGAEESAEGRVFGALPRAFGRRLSAAAWRADHSPLSSALLRGFPLDIVVLHKSPSRSGDPPWRWSSR